MTDSSYVGIAAQHGLFVEVGHSGDPDSTVAIVSDYPGGEEVNTGIPLSGPTGNYLWKELSRIGLSDRTRVYVTNICKRRVITTTKGKDSDDGLSAGELNAWAQVLDYELSQLPNLKYILVLGGKTLQGLFHKVGITKWRGSVLPYRQAHAVFTYNPAFVLRKDQSQELLDPRLEIILRQDLAKLKSMLNGEYTPHTVTSHVLWTYNEAVEAIQHCHQYAISNDCPLSVDTEHMNNETSVIGFGLDGHNAYVLPFYTPTENVFELEDEIRVRTQLNQMLNDKSVRIIGQNFVTDMYWLWLKDNIRVHGCWLDTKLAHWCLYPQYPHDLAHLVSQYTWHPYYKDEGITWKDVGDYQQYLNYNGKDVALTWYIAVEKLQPALIRNNLWNVFEQITMRLDAHLAAATTTGIERDEAQRVHFRDQYIKELDDDNKIWQKQIRTKLNLDENDPRTVNYASPQQLQQLYFRDLKLIGRGTSTDEDNTKRMINHPKTDDDCKNILVGALSLKAKAKLLGTYFGAKKTLNKDGSATYSDTQADTDGRFRCEYNNAGTVKAPGRLSSKSTIMGTGSNMQNQPKMVRSMYVASPLYRDEIDGEWCFAGGDSSQAEARYVGWRANIATWQDEFERARLGEDLDCHRSLAARIYNVPYDQVPIDDFEKDGRTPTIRYYAKRARHGLNYRMMIDRFAEANEIPVHVATHIFNCYHRENPELRIWWDKVVRDIYDQKRRTGTAIMYNAFGRRWISIERLTQSALDSVIAFDPQSSVGDLLKRAWACAAEDDDWPLHARIVLNVHDFLGAICLRKDAERCCAIMKKHAEYPMMINGKPLIIPFETQVSIPDEHGVHRWKNMKKLVLQ